MVVFPFVPVIAYTLPFANLYANSISPQIVSPLSLSDSINGVSRGTPGLTTQISKSASVAGSIFPAIHVTSLMEGLLLFNLEKSQSTFPS